MVKTMVTFALAWGSDTVFLLPALFRVFVVSGSWTQLGVVSQVSSWKIWQLTLCAHSSRTYPLCMSHSHLLQSLSSHLSTRSYMTVFFPIVCPKHRCKCQRRWERREKHP